MELPAIALERFVHPGQSPLTLDFPYNQRSKDHLLQLDMERWSRPGRYLYISELTVSPQLKHLCRKVTLLDESKLQGNPSSQGKQIESAILAETKKPIQTHWMEQKHCNLCTIKTYIHFVITFFYCNPNLASKLTRELLEAYNLVSLLEAGRSIVFKFNG